MKYPWNDYSRRLSPLKLAVFVALFCPALWVMIAFPLGWLGARPTNEAIHQIGLWTLRLIFIALAITPLRAILQWQRLILVRRLVGVAGRGRLPLGWVGALGVIAAVPTASGEAFYFWLAFGAEPERVIAANWSLMLGLRPATIVFGLGLAVTAGGILRELMAAPVKRR